MVKSPALGQWVADVARNSAICLADGFLTGCNGRMLGRRITDWWEAMGIRPHGQPISRHHGCMHGMIRTFQQVFG